jgi:hypothetical protein
LEQLLVLSLFFGWAQSVEVLGVVLVIQLALLLVWVEMWGYHSFDLMAIAKAPKKDFSLWAVG